MNPLKIMFFYYKTVEYIISNVYYINTFIESSIKFITMYIKLHIVNLNDLRNMYIARII